MKKEIGAILFGLIFSASSALAAPASTPAAAPANARPTAKVNKAHACKIAVVDVEKVYQDAPQIKRGEEEMKKKFGAREEQLKNRIGKFQKNMEDFKKNAPTMSDSDKGKREKELLKEQEELSKVMVEFQKSRGEFQTQVIKGFQNDFNRAVTSIVEEKQLDLVLNSAVVLNSNEGKVKNITKDILGKLK